MAYASDSYDRNQDTGVSESQGTSALSVSAAMALAKSSLEALTVRILGEVSEVSIKPGYKAAYFTVKDSSASLPCMMWNNRYRSSGVELKVGMLVELTGRFTLYAAKGRMNFDVFSIELAGEGNLRLKVANIARKLQAEGLTDPARKRRIPAFPEKIGLVTSPRSAAVHDVLRTLRRRFPVATVYLAGVPVEGTQAPSYLMEGLRCVVAAGAEVVLVVRGGGSFEDLMPFNDEGLARAITACPVPVVTGIGHEVDTSIADMVSDFRASTPTAAAEAVSPSAESLNSLFSSRAASLNGSAMRQIEARKSLVERAADKPFFTDPLTLFSSEALAVDAASERLARALPISLQARAIALDNVRERLLAAGPRLTQKRKLELSAQAGRLNDLSPLGVLARGYSYARDEQGSIVKSVEQAPVGSIVSLTLSDGVLDCEVKDAVRKDIFNVNER